MKRRACACRVVARANLRIAPIRRVKGIDTSVGFIVDNYPWPFILVSMQFQANLISVTLQCYYNLERYERLATFALILIWDRLCRQFWIDMFLRERR